jgi:hypothetical protein
LTAPLFGELAIFSETKKGSASHAEVELAAEDDFSPLDGVLSLFLLSVLVSVLVSLLSLLESEEEFAALSVFVSPFWPLRA